MLHTVLKLFSLLSLSLFLSSLALGEVSCHVMSSTMERSMWQKASDLQPCAWARPSWTRILKPRKVPDDHNPSPPLNGNLPRDSGPEPPG